MTTGPSSLHARTAVFAGGFAEAAFEGVVEAAWRGIAAEVGDLFDGGFLGAGGEEPGGVLEAVLDDDVLEAVSGGGFVTQAEGVGGDSYAGGKLFDVLAGEPGHEFVDHGGSSLAVGEVT